MANSTFQFERDINLHVENRITPSDASRQRNTAIEILRRLENQPGLILADEVGMGKTFVALAVGIAKYLDDPARRPVVVMVPPSIKQKWEADFKTFKERCIANNKLKENLRCQIAERTEELLKLLDEPLERRSAIVFLTHGAMARGLSDPWIKLALIQRSLKGRHNTEDIYNSLYRFVAEILELKGQTKRLDDPEYFWSRILNSTPDKWLAIINKYHLYAENIEDEPVPSHIIDALNELSTSDLNDVYENLSTNLPRRESSQTSQRLTATRRALKESMKAIWESALRNLKISSPLLIMDEAHHLKNAKTQVSQLFQSPDSLGDAEAVSKGYLAGVFDRMLFLTATPFQLGHYELVGVLERFFGINWQKVQSFPKEDYRKDLDQLSTALDLSQTEALRLERAWAALEPSDLLAYENKDWWNLEAGKLSSGRLQEASGAFQDCKIKMKAAETQLKKWVIRHLRPRFVEAKDKSIPRRTPLEGAGILTDISEAKGLEVSSESLLPFLLAARANACSPNTRPVFSEGLASSYEAFLDTRKKRIQQQTSLDSDDSEELKDESNPELEFYVSQIEKALNRKDGFTHHSHPKLDATVEKAFALWLKGEKVLVFCHYIETGKVLRYRISKRINDYILESVGKRLGENTNKAEEILGAIGKAIDKQKDIIDGFATEIFTAHQTFSSLEKYQTDIVDVMRRMIRSHSFIARYIPVEKYMKEKRLTKAILKEAFDKADNSGMSFRALFIEFLTFLAHRLEKADDFISALQSIRIGAHFGGDEKNSHSADELMGEKDDQLNPTVRLVNGSVLPETRNKLMLAFNTPFLPEVLIASTVMAEGVDLHMNCRYIIHHDLSWNPSTLEQRNGRVDRIGAKVEKCCHPIHIYLPYVEATQDEKMFKVVMDRERWFKVVMGDQVKIESVFETDKIASRVPFPETAAEELAFRLEVDTKF